MERTLVNAVATTIKHFRTKQNMSQEFLADQANLDRTYISGVERGVRNITLDSLEKIINALDVDIVTFLNYVAQEVNELHH